MKFVIFCNFFRIFWTPNGQKRLVATASTRGPIRSRHVDQSNRAMSLSPALSPRQCLASLSPASRPGGRSSAGERAIARRRPLARLSPVGALPRGRERGDIARSRRAPAPSTGAGLSPAYRPRAGGSGLFSPALPPALARALVHSRPMLRPTAHINSCIFAPQIRTCKLSRCLRVFVA
jgi:hypothetical protein